MAPLEFQRVCSVNAPKDILHPVLSATNPLSWIKEIILPCPTNTLFYLLFSSLHPAKHTSGKTPPWLWCHFCQMPEKSALPCFRPRLTERLVDHPKGSQSEEQRENSSAWSSTARGRLFLHPVPKEKIFLLGSTAEFGVQRGQSLAEALTRAAFKPPFPFSLYFCSHIKASQPLPSVPAPQGAHPSHARRRWSCHVHVSPHLTQTVARSWCDTSKEPQQNLNFPTWTKGVTSGSKNQCPFPATKEQQWVIHSSTISWKSRRFAKLVVLFSNSWFCLTLVQLN